MPATEIRCLSIRQPWVELILQGVKDVENRDWGALASLPTYRGWLAIHASKKIEPFHEDDFPGCTIPKHLPSGCIAGLAYLEDIVHINDYRKSCRKLKRPMSDWADGEHCLLLSQAIRLPTPIPYSGRLGIFKLPEELQKQLRKSLPS